MGARRPSGHGGGTYICCGDELRAVLTPLAGRNYPLIFPRQGWRYILNPNAQSQDKRARTNPKPRHPPQCAGFYVPLHVFDLLIRSVGANNRKGNKCRKNANYTQNKFMKSTIIRIYYYLRTINFLIYHNIHNTVRIYKF